MKDQMAPLDTITDIEEFLRHPVSVANARFLADVKDGLVEIRDFDVGVLIEYFYFLVGAREDISPRAKAVLTLTQVRGKRLIERENGVNMDIRDGVLLILYPMDGIPLILPPIMRMALQKAHTVH